MKIRNGFVSNSSSSSFLIMGVMFDPDKFEGDNVDIDDAYELLRIVAQVASAYDWVHYGLENYESQEFIGLSMADIEEDETKAQFRRRIFDVLRTIGYKGTIEDVRIYRDQGYN